MMATLPAGHHRHTTLRQVDREEWRVVTHAPVMPEPREMYKTEPSEIALTDGRARASTR